jgi:hypothetical protein
MLFGLPERSRRQTIGRSLQHGGEAHPHYPDYHFALVGEKGRFRHHSDTVSGNGAFLVFREGDLENRIHTTQFDKIIPFASLAIYGGLSWIFKKLKRS